MTLKDLVLDHLTYTYEKEAWQQSLAMTVEGLTALQAAWKPAAERHSIWQIVRHVAHWKRSVLAAWDGQPLDEDEISRTDWPEASGDDAAWQADLRTLHAISFALKEWAQGLNDEALSHSFAWYKGVSPQPLAIRLVRMATHDIYHAGQIQYIRALQGA